MLRSPPKKQRPVLAYFLTFPSMNKNEDYYQILGLRFGDALSAVDITKAYRKQAMLWHPDKNPDRKQEAEAQFKKINEANSVLSNEKERGLYDQLGHERYLEAKKSGGGGSGGFGFPFPFGPGMGQQAQQKPAQQIVRLQIDLQTAYCGKEDYAFETQVQRCCKDCQGSGVGAHTQTKKASTCTGCAGQGKIVRETMIGPGMLQRQVFPCGVCRGTGISISAEDACKTCQGQKLVMETFRKTLNLKPSFVLETSQLSLGEEGHYDVDLKRNLELIASFQIKIPNLLNVGSEAPNPPQSLIRDKNLTTLHTQQEEPYQPEFLMTKKNQLGFQIVISLQEFYQGFRFLFQHLDGKVYKVRSLLTGNHERDPVYDRFFSVSSLGFRDQHGHNTNDLIVECLVQFPSNLMEITKQEEKEQSIDEFSAYPYFINEQEEEEEEHQGGAGGQPQCRQM